MQLKRHMTKVVASKIIFSVLIAGYLMVSAPAGAQQVITAAPTNTPLTFGMDVNEASQALGTTLNYVRGRPGEEMYLALPNVKGSALSSRNDGLYLQFRRGKLEGWKGDWANNRPCCN